MLIQTNKIKTAVMRLFVKRLSAVATRIERLLCEATAVNSLSFFEISTITLILKLTDNLLTI